MHRTPSPGWEAGSAGTLLTCTWLPRLSLGSIAYSAGQVAFGSARTFIYGKRVAAAHLPTALWAPGVVHGSVPAGLAALGRSRGDASRQAFSGAALLTVSSTGLWGIPAPALSRCPLGRAPAPLGPLLGPPQVPEVGPGTSPGLRSRRWRHREVLLEKLPQKGSRGCFLQFTPLCHCWAGPLPPPPPRGSARPCCRGLGL